MGLYGRNITVSLDGTSSLPGFITQNYVPKLINVSSPTFSNSATLSNGSTISWNSDNLNTIGVGVVLDFDPRGVENHGKGFSGGTVTNFVHTEDDGSYTLTAADLANIPSNAKFSLQIGRGSYSRIAMDDGYHFGIATYSVLDGYFIKQ